MERIIASRDSQTGETYSDLQKGLKQFAGEDYFIITQNDHGFLQKQGFPEDKIWELYGNVNYFQCVHGKIFSNKGKRQRFRVAPE